MGVGNVELGIRGLHGRGLRPLLRDGRVVLRDGRFVRNLGRIEISLGDEIPLVEFPLPPQVPFAVHDGHLRLDGLRVSHGQAGSRILEIRPRLRDDGALIEDSGARGIGLGFCLVDLGLE